MAHSPAERELHWFGSRTFYLACGLLLLAVALAITVRYRRAAAGDPGLIPAIALAGPSSVSPGAVERFLVQVRDQRDGGPVRNEAVELFVSGTPSGESLLAEARTDDSGQALFEFTIPERTLEFGRELVAVLPRLRGASAALTIAREPVTRAEITIDQALYQPGQALRFRVLARRSDDKPASAEELELELLNPAQVRLLRRKLRTSEFGVAQGELELADDAAPGTYALRASVGRYRHELSFEVVRAASPLLQAELAVDGGEGGQPIRLTVQARYRSGAPAPAAEVKWYERGKEALLGRGTTDREGKATIEVARDRFGSRLELRARVELENGLAAEANLDRALSPSLAVAAFPEAGFLVAGVENEVFVVTSDDHGAPRAATVRLGTGPEVKTSEYGVARLKLPPAASGEALVVRARDPEGTSAETSLSLARRPALLIRTSRASFVAGRPIQLTLQAPARSSGPVTVELWKRDRPLAIAHGELREGSGEVVLDVPAEASGLLRVAAHGSFDGRALGGQRLLLVEGSSDLVVRAELEPAAPAPGSAARLHVNVHSASGRPVPAALGAALLDEASFASMRARPDLERRLLGIEADVSDLRRQRAAGEAEAGAPATGARAVFEPLSPGGLDGSDPKLGDRRLAALSALAQSLPPREPANLRASPAVVSAAAREAQARSSGWGALIFLFLGGLCLAEFAAYGVARWHWSRPVSGVSAAELQDFRKSMRLLSLLFAVAFVVSLLAVTWLMLRPSRLPTLVLPLWVASTFALCVGQVKAVVTLRQSPMARWLPAFARLVWLLPIGALLLPIAVSYLALDDFVLLDLLAIPRHRFLAFLVFLALLWQLCFGALALLSRAGVENSDRRRRAGWLLSRASWLGLPLALVAFAALLPRTLRSESVARRFGVAKPMSAQGSGSASAALRTTTRRAAAPQPGSPSRTPYFGGEVLTNAQGRATLELSLPDAKGSYRLSLSAAGSSGELGAVVLPVQVAQDFSARIELPAKLTQGDALSAPIVVQNHLNVRQTLNVTLESEGLALEGEPRQELELAPGANGAFAVKLRARDLGKHLLKATLRGAAASSVVTRETSIEPHGERRVALRAGAVLDPTTLELTLLPAIGDAYQVLTRAYGDERGAAAEWLERAAVPASAAFELSRESAYPAVLLLASLGKGASGELAVRAQAAAEQAYQRLLMFEGESGGFARFQGQAADVVSTSDGILTLMDLARVVAVDPALMTRASAFLRERLQPDGTLSGKVEPGEEGRDRTRAAARVVHALITAGERGERLDQALARVEADQAFSDPYSSLLRAQALLAAGRKVQARSSLESVLPAVRHEGTLAFVASDTEGLSGARGDAVVEESTALLAHVLGLLGEQQPVRRAALAYLERRRDEHGRFASTAATVAAWRALLQEQPPQRAATGRLTVAVNGAAAGQLALRDGAAHGSLALTNFRPGKNNVELRSTPAGNAAYQLVAAQHVPWQGTPGTASKGPLELGVLYAPMSTRVGFPVVCHVQVLWRRKARAGTSVVEVGIPPGFEVEHGDLERLVASGRIRAYAFTGEHLHLYFHELADDRPTAASFTLRSLYPVRAMTPSSKVYPLSERELSVEAPPSLITAR